MRLVCFFVALFIGSTVVAQDKPGKPAAKKKQQQQHKQAAHKKPTPEQIRRFNELEKKQKK